MCGVEPLVMSASEESESFGVAMFCRASIVDEGGVFSPRMGLNEGLEGLRLGVSLPFSLPPGVGVPDFVGLFSGERFSKSNPDAREKRSGDLSGDLSWDRSSEFNASV